MIKHFLVVTALATTTAALLLVTGCDDDFDCHGQAAPGSSLELAAQPLKPTPVAKATKTNQKSVTSSRPRATVTTHRTTHHYHGC